MAMSDELGNLLEPIILSWRVSELKRWVEDYRSDTNADILCFHSGAKGYIDIYNEYPRPLVGMGCEHPINGGIELIPYLLEGATPSAIAELRRWRDALEAAGAITFEENGRRHYEPIVIGWNRGELFEWLKWRYVTTYTIEPWRNLTSEGELFIYGLCPYSPCAMNVYLRVKDALPNGTVITPRVTVRNDENRQHADTEIDNLRNQLEAAGAMTPRKSKRGPRPKTKEEKIAAIRTWDALDRDRFAITLEEWLEERFGTTGGKLNVPPSTFHGWRKLK
jgi:hypothetical protein